jgi:glycerophosphoryl diester phosphodiesterase
MTLYAYEQSAMLMMRSMEISVWRSADGVFVCSHDQNTSRVTGTSMDIPTSNWSAISALMVNPVGTDNQAQPARPICRIEEVLSHFGLTHVLFVEDKSGSNGSALLDILDAYGGATHHIWKMYGVSVNNVQRAQAQARGYKTWGYYFLADNANIASTAASWDLIGLDFNMSDAQITAAVGLGRPAVGHIIANTTQRDRMLSLGCIGVVDAAPKTVFPW